MKYFEVVLWVIAGILLVDILGFCWWSLSGQIPADGFFIGTITSHLIL